MGVLQIRNDNVHISKGQNSEGDMGIDKKENSSITIKEQYDILFSEYMTGIEHTKRYAQVVNWCLNLTIVGLGALLTATLKESSVFVYKLMCIYLIPVFIYIFGIYYVYTLYMIGNVENYMHRIEKRIAKFSTDNDVIGIIGWNTYLSKKNESLTFVTYGFLAIVFVLYPPISVLFGNFNTIYGGSTIQLHHYPEWDDFSVIFLPGLIYLIYLVLGFCLVSKNVQIRLGRS